MINAYYSNIIIHLGLFGLISFFPFMFYYIGASESRDPLFFLRKKQFLKKMNEESFYSVSTYLCHFFNLSENKWIYDEKRDELYYKVNEQTTLTYDHTCNPSLTFYEGSGQKSLFSLYSSDNFKDIFYDRAYLKGHLPTEEEEFIIKNLLSKLEEFFIKKRAKHKEEIKRKTKKLDNNEIREKLLHTLKTKKNLLENYEDDNFSFVFKDTKDTFSFSISYNGTLYFQSFFLKSTKRRESNIAQIISAEARVFSELKNELDAYSAYLFTLKEKDLGISFYQEDEFKNNFSLKISSLTHTLKELEKDKSWLSLEHFHKINQTLPKDLDNLLSVYETLRDKESVKDELEQSIYAIEEKIEKFICEIEENKKNHIKKQRQVIEVR